MQQNLKKQPPEVFHKGDNLKNLKFQLCWNLFYNKVVGHRCFPVNFLKYLRTPFS